MAWILVWIVFAALSTASAYKHPYHSYPQQYQGQTHETSQYQRVADGSLEQKTDTLTYQKRLEDIQSINQKHFAKSSPWRNKIPIKSSVPFEYYGKSVRDGIKVSPASKDVQVRKGYSSSKTYLPKTYPSVANSKEVLNLGSTLYSRYVKSESRNMFTPQISEECEELGICENSPDYPHEYVATLLAKLPVENIIFNLDKESPKIDTEDLNSNQTLMPCTAKARIIYPDKVRTKTGKWVFVVNGKNDKVQGFSGTMCIAPNQQCNYTVTFRDGFSPTCVQILSDRSMWALGDDGEMVLVTTSIPSCCVCELHQM